MRVARIELASFAWKADILAIIRHPRASKSIPESAVYYKHMHVSKFSNDLDDANVSSSGLAAENLQEVAASSQASFEQRQQVEQARKTIAKYTDSFVARQPTTPGVRTSYQQRKAALEKRAAAVPDRQAFNAANPGAPSGAAGQPAAPAQRIFQEPPSRGYNPYA